MNQILELEITDDIASIKSRIEYVLPALILHSQQMATTDKEPRRLLLVVPRKNKAIQNLVNMKLLARMMRSRSATCSGEC